MDLHINSILCLNSYVGTQNVVTSYNRDLYRGLIGDEP